MPVPCATIERRRLRRVHNPIAFDAALPEKSVVTLYCRQGLETMLLDDSRRYGRAHVVKAGQVELITAKPLSALYTLRLMIDVAFRLPASSVVVGSGVASKVSLPVSKGRKRSNQR